MKNLILITIFSCLPLTLAQAFGIKPLQYRTGLLRNVHCHYDQNHHPYHPVKSTFTDDLDVSQCFNLANSESMPAQGLLGRAILSSSQMKPSGSAMDYYNTGTKQTHYWYFADINLDWQAASQGYSANGEALTDDNGQTLTTNFAVEYNTSLQLGPNDSEGDYELVNIADGGAQVLINENSTWKTLLNNDLRKGGEYACSAKSVHLTRNSRVPVKIIYHQGGSPSLAQVLMWRLKTHQSFLQALEQQIFCAFSHSRTPSSAQAYSNLITYLQHNHWQVLSADNYQIPDGALACAQTPPPVQTLSISDFAVVSAQAPTATVHWTTTLPASSQIYILNNFTGEELYTELDSNLVTDHNATLTGLTHGVYYQIRAISVDDDGNSVQTNLIDLLP